MIASTATKFDAATGRTRRRAVRRVVTALAAICSTVASSGVAAAPAVRWKGVNLAGGEFNAGRSPSRYGKDYVYPTAKVAAPFVQAGMNIARLPIAWKRLQPAPLQPLDAAELKRVDAAIAALDGFDRVILDVHNYGRFGGKVLQPGTANADYLPDLWKRLAAHYADDRRVVFGLMNEPHGISARDWRSIADGAVQAIRKTGARNLILVPGTRWSGAHSWAAGGAGSNAAAFADFTDPANNFAFDMHQYLDADSSGTHRECVSPEKARRRLSAATKWLRANHFKGFLGEFGAANNEECQAALASLLTTMQRNGDDWEGWTYWAGGPWWGDYFMSIQPGKDGEKKPQMAVLERFLPAGSKQ